MNTRVGMVYGVVPSRNNVWSVWRPLGCAVVAYTRLRGVVGVISWSHESLEDLEARGVIRGLRGVISWSLHPEPMQCPRWTVLGALESVGPAGAAHQISAAKKTPVEQELNVEHP